MKAFSSSPITILISILIGTSCVAQSVSKKKKGKPSNQQSTMDVKKYYFKSGELSVEIKSIDRLEELIILYNRKGEKTYELINSRKHGVQQNELSFYDNGAVNKVNGRQMPDGGIKGYIYEIRFNENNLPQSKVVQTNPARTVLESMGVTYLWSDKTKGWIKQETIDCQPTPEK